MKSKENYSGFKGILKLITSIISWTTLVILILVALFLAYYTISTRIYESKGEKYEPIISLYTIVSGSMEPNIKIYDVVVAVKVNSPKSIKVGDVITFKSTSNISKGMIITHRVTDVVETSKGVEYKTKFYNNVSPDSAPSEFNNVIGQVVFRIPALGRVQSFLGTQGGWLIVIVIPALFIIISDILKIFKLSEVKNKVEKIEADKKRIRKEKIERENLRKDDIKKRLRLEKSLYEPDPIITNKMMRMVVAEKAPTTTKPKVLSRSATRNKPKYNQNNSYRKSKKKKNKR